MSLRFTSRRACGRRQRRGNVLIMTAVGFPIFIGFVAFAVDWGHIAAAQAQLQNAADSAALAAAAKIIEDRSLLYEKTPQAAANVTMSFYAPGRAEAQKFANNNKVYGSALDLDTVNDVEFFFLNPDTMALSSDDPTIFNTVRVTTRRTASLNGALPLYFSGMFGMGEAPLVAVAQATFYDDVKAIGPPPTGESSSLMPFAVHKDHWAKVMDALANPGRTYDLDGDGKDDIDDAYKHDSTATGNGVSDGKDQIPELRMFPDASGKNGVLTPGNFGTVDIGDGSNSANDLKRQIEQGPNAADFAELPGGKLDFTTPFVLEGDTGISGGIADSLNSIIGTPRTVVIYDTMAGVGNNAQYRIVGFVGVRVMFQNLNGGLKGVWIQPAPVSDPGAIPGMGAPKHNVYGPLHLSK
jgi:Flp pilus assembly protein TadG